MSFRPGAPPKPSAASCWPRAKLRALTFSKFTWHGRRLKQAARRRSSSSAVVTTWIRQEFHRPVSGHGDQSLATKYNAGETPTSHRALRAVDLASPRDRHGPGCPESLPDECFGSRRSRGALGRWRGRPLAPPRRGGSKAEAPVIPGVATAFAGHLVTFATRSRRREPPRFELGHGSGGAGERGRSSRGLAGGSRGRSAFATRGRAAPVEAAPSRRARARERRAAAARRGRRSPRHQAE